MLNGCAYRVEGNEEAPQDLPKRPNRETEHGIGGTQKGCVELRRAKLCVLQCVYTEGFKCVYAGCALGGLYGLCTDSCFSMHASSLDILPISPAISQARRLW